MNVNIISNVKCLKAAQRTVKVHFKADSFWSKQAFQGIPLRNRGFSLHVFHNSGEQYNMRSI